MGFITNKLGRGKDSKGVGETRSALEQAENPRSGSQGAVTKVVQSLLEVGIDGRGRFDSAARVADAARAKHGGDADKAVDDIVNSHLRLAGASGFLTNLGGFAAMAVSLPANVFGFYVLATRMAASIAHVRGHDLSRPEVRSAVLLSLVGGYTANQVELPRGPALDVRRHGAPGRVGVPGRMAGHTRRPAGPGPGPGGIRTDCRADRDPARVHQPHVLLLTCLGARRRRISHRRFPARPTRRVPVPHRGGPSDSDPGHLIMSTEPSLTTQSTQCVLMNT